MKPWEEKWANDNAAAGKSAQRSTSGPGSQRSATAEPAEAATAGEERDRGHPGDEPGCRASGFPSAVSPEGTAQAGLGRATGQPSR